jgi:DNA-binding response OmpR family regulator
LTLLHEVLGYEAETARDGAAALALQQTHGFGVLITDIFMPGIEGMETIARFKAGWPAMRVIAMSGGGERTKRDYLSAALQIGADAAMRKPFSLSTLISALGHVS